MTTIAYKQGLMSADTRVIQGHAIIGDVTKITRRPDGALCGCAGDAVFASLFHAWFLDGCPKALEPERGDSDQAVVVDRRRKIEVYEAGGSFVLLADYCAIGSGKEFALGAMSISGTTAEDGVMAALRHDPYSGGGIVSIHHEG